MKRAMSAALLFAAAGAVIVSAPARASTGYAAVMVGGTPATFGYAKGVCSTSSGDGNFDIHVGDTIAWRNCSTTSPHTATADHGEFDTGDIPASSPPDEPVILTFNSPGTFPYHCTHHPTQMKGTIKVTGEAPTTTRQTTATTQAATSTTKKATTTTSSTIAAPTTTTEDINGIFEGTIPPEPSTTLFTTDTTRALGKGGGEGTSAGVVAGLVLGLGAIGTAVALVVRRLRAGVPPS
jgi:hypothetical protein